MRKFSFLLVTSLALISLAFSACSSKFSSSPKAKDKVTQAMQERYQAMLEEAGKLKAENALDLLHHFGEAVLTRIKPDDFKAQAGQFIAEVGAGKFKDIKFNGGRAPGKVRLLLVNIEGKDIAVPFVKSADGWMFDDVDIAFGDSVKVPDVKGCVPVNPPSPLSAISTLMDAQASSLDRTSAAIDLADAKDQTTAKKYAAKEKETWPKTALLYAAWKGGAACEPFAAAFPADGALQKELYDNDTDSFRALVKGLTNCAAESKKLNPTLKVYQACYKAEGGTRSEYVDPVVALADAQPGFIIKAAIKSKYRYEEDPVANIVVGALHGIQKSKFYQFVTKKAGSSGASGKVAKAWVEKMAQRDKEEPLGTHPEEAKAKEEAKTK